METPDKNSLQYGQKYLIKNRTENPNLGQKLIKQCKNKKWIGQKLGTTGQEFLKNRTVFLQCIVLAPGKGLSFPNFGTIYPSQGVISHDRCEL